MDRNRLLMLGAALAAVIVIAGGFLLGVQPQLKAASDAQSSEQGVASQNDTLAASLTTLKSQYSHLDSLTSQLGILQASVPSTAASAAFIDEVNAVAKSTGVTLSSLTIGDAIAYAPPASSVVAPTDTSTSTDTASASPSASATASATPTVAATPTSPTLATSSLITAANFSDLPVSVNVTGTYAQGLAFIKGLRTGERLFVASTITSTVAQSSSTGSDDSTSSSSSAGNVSWSIGGLIYALSDSSTATDPSTGATSTAAGTSSDSATTDSAAGK